MTIPLYDMKVFIFLSVVTLWETGDGGVGMIEFMDNAKEAVLLNAVNSQWVD